MALLQNVAGGWLFVALFYVAALWACSKFGKVGFGIFLLLCFAGVALLGASSAAAASAGM